MSNLQTTDVAIIGGGIAGSAAAVQLGKLGIDATLIDPQEIVPKDFRCEKFNNVQIDTINRMGLADILFPSLTPVNDVLVARFGRVVNRVDYPHYGFSYEEVINALREAAYKTIRFCKAKVRSIENNGITSKLALSNGDTLEAKLVVVANGLNPGLQKFLGIERKMISEHHCMAIGFDVVPSEGTSFPFDTLTYWPESTSSKMAYFTIFKSGNGWRTNLFGYWEKDSETMISLKNQPEATLLGIMPNLFKNIGQFTVDGNVRIRPIDLYSVQQKPLDGVVLIGDAYSTSCPGAGTGAGKALIDVEQLCGKYIPSWLNAPSITATDIAAFYADNEKTSNDASSLDEAYALKSISIDRGMEWVAKRWARFGYHWAKGALKGVPLEPLFNSAARKQS